MVNHENPLTKQFFKLLEERYRGVRTVCEYARLLNTNPDYLTRVVAAATGKKPAFHIRCRIINEAYKMYVGESLSLKEIGWELEFKNPIAFYRFWKRWRFLLDEDDRSEKSHK